MTGLQLTGDHNRLITHQNDNRSSWLVNGSLNEIHKMLKLSYPPYIKPTLSQKIYSSRITFQLMKKTWTNLTQLGKKQYFLVLHPIKWLEISTRSTIIPAINAIKKSLLFRRGNVDYRKNGCIIDEVSIMKRNDRLQLFRRPICPVMHVFGVKSCFLKTVKI